MTPRVIAVAGGLCACILIALAAAAPPRRILDAYDHVSTGFLLDGRHADLRCEACHVGATFAGTPRRCEACHNNVLAVGKTFRHIPTTDRCESCHTTKDWLTSRFDHSGIVTNCVSCHNNFTAPGKTANHPVTSNVCEDCHRAVHWNQLLPGARR